MNLHSVSTENAPVVVVPSPSGHNQATMVLSAELRETRDRQLTPGDREKRGGDFELQNDDMIYDSFYLC